MCITLKLFNIAAMPVLYIFKLINKLRPNKHSMPGFVTAAWALWQKEWLWTFSLQLEAGYNQLDSVCIIFFLRLSQIFFPCGHHFFDNIFLLWLRSFLFAISSSDFPFSQQIPWQSEPPPPEFTPHHSFIPSKTNSNSSRPCEWSQECW